MDKPEHSSPGGSQRQGVKIKSLSTTPVERHKLRFSTREDLLAAMRQQREHGHTRFRNGAKHDLIGRIVRVSEERLILEVDAAADI